MSDTARIYQLMVLSAWADGKVEPSEALAIHEIASADPRFAGLVGKTGIAQEMKGRIDKLGLEGALREAASWITQRE
ncbi:MAG TPA: hypothetical protein VM691_01010, partial [Myxococcales bacterium]|nr:hypothetical protein [Myxococcales bacterium]